MDELIEQVSEEQLQHFIDLWIGNARNRPCLRKVRWYSVDSKGRAVAVDNTTDNCWNEFFVNEEEAVKWLTTPELRAIEGIAVEEE